MLHELQQEPEKCVPIGIFGDDAGVFATKQVLVLLWGSVATQTLTLDSRLLFTAVTYAHIVPEKTLRVLYQVLVCSLNCLASGRFPHADHRGVPFGDTYCPRRRDKAGQLLANGFRGIFSEVRGDWKWQAESLHLDCWYKTAFMCHLCRAHRRIRRLWFTQFQRTSHIRRTLISARAFRDWQRGRPVENQSPFLDLIGFSIWRVWVDAMHCLDLGVYQTICASGLKCLVRLGVWPGDNTEEQFHMSHVDYKAWCKQKGFSACPRFEPSKLLPRGEYPSFSQQSAKAAMTKHLVFWLYDVLCRPGVATEECDMVWLLFDQWVRFENICDRNGRFLADADIAPIAEAVESALQCHLHLNSVALANNELDWQIIPKCHMATHLGFDNAASGVNPTKRCYPAIFQQFAQRIQI